MKAHPTLDVVSLGEAMVEFNQTHAGRPDYLQGFGGDTSNAVIAAARAGARTAYLSRVGADAFGDMLMDLWAREGVSTQAIERDTLAPTGLYFVTHGDTGHSFSYRRAGSAASLMTPAWLDGTPRQLVHAAKVLHLSGISLAISPQACDTAFAALHAARAAETLVAFDSNLRLKLWPLDRAQACIRHAVGLCDLFLPSLDDMVQLTGLDQPEAIADWGHAQGAPTVVLKLGGEGVLVSHAGRREHLPAHPVKVVDATGAGDCFCGNLLARVAAGEDVFAAARYANAAAALAVQGWGAVAPLPTAEAVQQLLVP